MLPFRVLEDSPIAYYRFGEAVGTTVAIDHSGNASHGTFSPTGITLGVPGVDGDTAALFSNGRMIVSNNASLNPGNITLEALIIWSGDNGFQQRIIEKSRFVGGEASQYGLSILPDGKVMVEIQVNAADSSLISTVALNSGQPYHVAASYDGNLMRIYFDGIPSGEQTATLNGELASNSTNLSVGNQADRDRPFNGIIDEVALYKKALSNFRLKVHITHTAKGDDLQPGEGLSPGESITSANGQYTLIYQGDGNLVLYRNWQKTPKWASNTDGKPAGIVIMQNDGNLVMYGPDAEYIWDTATGGHAGAHLVVQDDGNVVIYDSAGTALWATNTNVISVVVAGFLASTSGFHFNNAFPAVPQLTIDILGQQIPIGDASNGLCGGMVFAARDYFEAGVSIPPDSAPPSSGALFDFFVKRLYDSFNLLLPPAPPPPPFITPLPPFFGPGPLTYLWLMSPDLPDHETVASNILLAPRGRAWIMINDAWPMIKGNLDSGRLSPISLVEIKSRDAAEMGVNHQVLAYGYNLDGTELALRIYDPNHHDDDTVTLSLSIADPQHTTPVTHSAGTTVWCFFQPVYLFSPPPS